MKVYLIYDTSMEAQSIADEIHDKAADRLAGYSATRWADILEHPDGEEWAVPFDTDRADGLMSQDEQERLGEREILTQSQASDAGWFPEPDLPEADAVPFRGIQPDGDDDGLYWSDDDVTIEIAGPGAIDIWNLYF